MSDNYNPNTERNESGQFTHKAYGAKKIRSMKLTDHAWHTLEKNGLEQGISRTDVIEEFTRAVTPDDTNEIEKLKAKVLELQEKQKQILEALDGEMTPKTLKKRVDYVVELLKS